MADETRDRLALALDVDDLVAALRLAQRVRPWFGVAKVGLELFAAAGPEAVLALSGRGLPGLSRSQAARHPDHGGAGRPGHRRSGRRSTPPCTRPGAWPWCGPPSRVWPQGAAAAGLTAPSVLGVTVLTSEQRGAGPVALRSGPPWPPRPAAAGSCAPRPIWP